MAILPLGIGHVVFHGRINKTDFELRGRRVVTLGPFANADTSFEVVATRIPTPGLRMELASSVHVAIFGGAIAMHGVMGVSTVKGKIGAFRRASGTFCTSIFHFGVSGSIAVCEQAFGSDAGGGDASDVMQRACVGEGNGYAFEVKATAELTTPAL